MRLLFICKRHPQQRDLIQRPYGRFYHLPMLLASLGHDVQVALCSHRRLPAMAVERNGVRWSSYDLRSLGPARLIATLDNQAEIFRPDWIVGCSDAWIGWLAHRIARHCGARLAIDAYDNFEAYMPWNLPLHHFWRRAVKAADLVTAAGPQLAEMLDRERHGKPGTQVLPMAADPAFRVLDKESCRSLLGLETGAPLLGYYGGWARNRGTDLLLESFRLVRAQAPDARLVLSGRPPANVAREPGVVSLGYIDDDRLPAFVNALDVSCVVTADSRFGRYSYPAKLCEAMACGTPVAATDSAPVRWMLKGDERFLTSIGDAQAFAERALLAARLNKVDYGKLPSWKENAATLAGWLQSPPTVT